jgi:hypothetical protein
LRAAAVAVWIVKAAISNTPRTVKILSRILVSIERALLKTTAPGLFRFEAAALLAMSTVLILVGLVMFCVLLQGDEWLGSWWS